MTKLELVNQISSQTAIEKSTVTQTLEALIKTIQTSLIEGDNVYLRGFGTFAVKHRAEKTARNITKNTQIIIPAHNIPSFKPGEEFRKCVINAGKK